MNDPQKRQPQQVPKPSNPAIEELIALRQEMTEFRKDFGNFQKELSRHIAFGVIGSLVLAWLIAGFFGLLGAMIR
jgi:hypothetical protein